MSDNDRLLRISNHYLTRGKLLQNSRAAKNQANWDAYYGEQDWSHKADYQSRETTPGFPMAVEHIIGTFERALTDSDDWVEASLPGIGQPLLSPSMVRAVLLHYLSRLCVAGNRPDSTYGVQVYVGDSVKHGILEGQVVGKIYPVMVKRRSTRFKKVKKGALDPGTYPYYDYLGDPMAPIEVEEMRLALDLIPYEDYFRDPSPALNWEMHRTRRQLHELRQNPDYDQEGVERLYGRAEEQLARESARRQNGEDFIPSDPYEIEVFEVWGNVIDETTGEVVHTNVFWTWAGSEILRPPTPNPFWDGTRPFVTSALLRPRSNSAVPKALADHAVPMWRAGNELVNLYLDSSMRGAWGLGQLRTDIMEAPEEVAGGMPQGYTAVLRPNTPLGAKFYERVDNGDQSNVTLDGLNRVNAFVNEALATPDTKLGQLPTRQVKATEIVQAMQASGSLYESLASRYEDTHLEPLFEKAWKIIVQYADDFISEEFVQILGARLTLMLSSMPPKERWRFVSHAKFKVRGLRGVAAREREFNKKMTVVNLLAQNPAFAEHFGRTYSYEKLWESVLRASGNDPAMLEIEPQPPADVAPEEAAAEPQLNEELLTGPAGSPPGDITSAEGQRGAESQFAPNNPNAPGSGPIA